MIIGACAQLHPAEDAEDEDANDELVDDNTEEIGTGLADYNTEDVDDKRIDDEQEEDASNAAPGGGALGSEGHAVAWNLAALVLPECVSKVKAFKVEEAAKVLGACKRLGLRRPDVSNMQQLQQEASSAAKAFVDIVTDQLPAALSFKPKQR